MADAIRSYLINLGFKLDEPGLRKFNEQIVKTHHVVRDFSIAFAGFAIGIEEAIRRTARQFENLFYLSQQTGISVSNLKSINFAVGQIGLSASAVDQALSSMTLSLIKNPGLVGFVNQYVPGFKDAEQATEGLARHLRGLIDNFGRYSPQVAQFANTIEAMGADFGMVFQRALNQKEFDAWKQRSKEVLQALLPIGTTADKIAKEAVDALNQWRFTWHITDVGLERLISATFPAFTRILETFNAWLMKGETVQAFENIAKSIEEWVKKDENIKSVEETLKTVGGAAKILAEGIWEVVKGFVWLSDHTNPLTAVVVAFFVAVAAKAAIAEGAIIAVNAAIWGTGASLRGVAAIAAGLGGIAAFIWGMSPSTANAGEDEAIKKGLRPPSSQAEADRQRQQQLDKPKERTFWDMWTDWVHKNFPKPSTGGPDTFEGPGQAPIPGARKSSFGGDEGGVTSTSEALFNMFGAWFKGDTAFRPIVVIADEYYTKLVDALRNMTGLGGRSTGEGGGGFSNTPGKGRGFSGVAGAGGAGGGGGGPGAIPSIEKGNIRNQAIDFFVSRGWSREQAAGIAANLETESNWRPGISGDAGAAFGIGQWHPDRQANFRRVFGKDIRGSSIAEQLAFVDWELKNTESGAGSALKGATTAHAAGGIVSRLYERPADVSGNANLRGSLAEQILRGHTPGQGRSSARTSSIDAAIGDSIAVGLAGAAGVPSDAIGGTTPKEIYDRVIKHVRDYAGKTVALGSGSNDPSQLEYVHDTMKELHKVGAKVVLLGVGSGVRNYLRTNKQLGEYAREFGDPFTGELEGTEGGRVHPRSYRSTLDQVHRALGTEGRHSSRTNNIDSDYNVNINVHGASDPHGTARQVQESMDRRSMLHSRNLRTSIA